MVKIMRDIYIDSACCHKYKELSYTGNPFKGSLTATAKILINLYTVLIALATDDKLRYSLVPVIVVFAIMAVIAMPSLPCSLLDQSFNFQGSSSLQWISYSP